MTTLLGPLIGFTSQYSSSKCDTATSHTCSCHSPKPVIYYICIRCLYQHQLHQHRQMLRHQKNPILLEFTCSLQKCYYSQGPKTIIPPSFIWIQPLNLDHCQLQRSPQRDHCHDTITGPTERSRELALASCKNQVVASPDLRDHRALIRKHSIANTMSLLLEAVIDNARLGHYIRKFEVFAPVRSWNMDQMSPEDLEKISDVAAESEIIERCRSDHHLRIGFQLACSHDYLGPRVT